MQDLDSVLFKIVFVKNYITVKENSYKKEVKN
jgi:hypothetical protein